MKISRFIIHFLLLTISLLYVPVGLQAGWLEHKQDLDTAYLPYRLDVIDDRSASSATKLRLKNCAWAAEPRSDFDSTGVIYRIWNPSTDDDLNSTVSELKYPSLSIEDDPLHILASDFRMYPRSDTAGYGLIAIGFKNDSLYCERLYPNTDELELLLLLYEPEVVNCKEHAHQIVFAHIGDYDDDSITEALILIKGERCTGTRRLYCVNLEPLYVEWERELGPITDERIVKTYYDSTGRGYLLSTNNTKQGAFSEYFSDSFAYLAKINSKSEVLYHTVLQYDSNEPNLCGPTAFNHYFITYSQPFIHPDSTQTDLRDTAFFGARIDSYGNVLNTSARLPGRVRRGWISQWDTISEAFYISTQDEKLVVLDSNMNILEQLEGHRVSDYLGTIRIDGYSETCVVCVNGIYTNRLEQLLAFPFIVGSYDIFGYDADSNATGIVLNTTDRFLVADIQHKDIVSLIFVFYHNNLILILMMLSGLLAGLLVVNVYRIKTRRNLKTISLQRDQLEKAHTELKTLQSKLIDAEKFRQAKDIAGGFAHEIRNALLPVETSVYKLANIEVPPGKPQQIKTKHVAKIDDAIHRAIKLTTSISEYTKLDKTPEVNLLSVLGVVDKVLANNSDKISTQSVEVIKIIPESLQVSIQSEQLYSVINNLLLNSLDAMRSVQNQIISIKVNENNGDISLMFTDNGCGIEDENRDKVFDVFFSTKPSKGHGMGMSVVKKIIENYNGEISIESSLESGTTISIKLPKDFKG